MQEIGVETTPKIMSFDDFLTVRRAGDFDVVVRGFRWGPSGASGDQRQLFHGDPPGGFNVMGYRSDEYDELDDRQRVEFDDQARTQLQIELSAIAWGTTSRSGSFVFSKSRSPTTPGCTTSARAIMAAPTGASRSFGKKRRRPESARESCGTAPEIITATGLWTALELSRRMSRLLPRVSALQRVTADPELDFGSRASNLTNLLSFISEKPARLLRGKVGSRDLASAVLPPLRVKL